MIKVDTVVKKIIPNILLVPFWPYAERPVAKVFEKIILK